MDWGSVGGVFFIEGGKMWSLHTHFRAMPMEFSHIGLPSSLHTRLTLYIHNIEGKREFFIDFFEKNDILYIE